MARVIGPLSPTWKTLLSSQLLVSVWSSSDCCNHLGSKPINEKITLCVELCLYDLQSKMTKGKKSLEIGNSKACAVIQ